MLMEPKTTRRKFYNKWLYKVTLNMPGASALRVYSRDEIDKVINETNHNTNISIYRKKLWNNRQNIKSLLSHLDQYDDNEWAHRVESVWMDIYTNNKNLYDDIGKNFSSFMVHRFEPKSDSLENLDSHSMLVKKLPHDRFNYRVYLSPHKITDNSDKEKFLNWLENQKPRVTCTDSIKKWFRKTNSNWDRRYILVEDDGTLLMMKLRNPDVVGTVYKFEIE